MFDRDELRGLADEAAGADPRGSDDGELLAAVAALEAVRRRVDAALAHVVGELDHRGTTDTVRALHTAGWIAFTQRLPRGECSALVRAGRFLHSHPTVNAALVEGTISLAHVRVLQRLCTPRVAHVIAAIQHHVVDLAARVGFDAWRAEVASIVELADADGAHEPRVEDNRLSVGAGLDGVVHVTGQLVGDQAVTFTAVLDAATDRLALQAHRDARTSGGELPVPDRSVLRALALAELVRQGAAAGHAGSGPVADVTLVVRTPDWLPEECCRRADGQSEADWLAGLLVTTLDGTPVKESVARILCCDPLFRTHVENHLGEVLTHGRAHRHATAAQRRAAGVRFGGCCFPGCCTPMSWADMHHVHEWDADGGPTDQENLAPLCRYHHGVVHRNGWGIRTAPHGFDITTPTGQVMPCQTGGRQPVPA